MSNRSKPRSNAEKEPVDQFAHIRAERTAGMLELFNSIADDAHVAKREAFAKNRAAKLKHYGDRRLHLFLQFDNWGEDGCNRSVTDECMQGAGVARVLIAPGVPPADVRKALDRIGRWYEEGFAESQEELAREAARLLGVPDPNEKLRRPQPDEWDLPF